MSNSLGDTGREVAAYSAGRQAWDRGLPEGSNPYTKSKEPELWRKWGEGWRQALADSEKTRP